MLNSRWKVMLEDNGRNDLLGIKYWAFWDKTSSPWYTILEYESKETLNDETLYSFRVRNSTTVMCFTIEAFELKLIRPFIIYTKYHAKLLEKLE